MLQYDSVHGRFKGDVAVDGDTLVVNGKKIRLTPGTRPGQPQVGRGRRRRRASSRPACSSTKETAQKHLDAGAKKVILSAPSKDDTPMFVYGVNDKTLRGRGDHLQRLVHDQLPGAGRQGAATTSGASSAA